jgi:hypothetical protein
MADNTKEVTSDCFDDFFHYAVDNLPEDTHYSLILLGIKPKLIEAYESRIEIR